MPPRAGDDDGKTSAMHDIKWIRDNPEAFDHALKRRGLAEDVRKNTLNQILELDEQRRAAIAQVQQWQERRNRISKEIGDAKKMRDEARAAQLMEEVSRLKSDITKAGEQVIRDRESDLFGLLTEIPNVPLDEVPDGRDANSNVERHRFGAKRDYGFAPKQHFDLGEALGQMDFETAAKLSGTRFVVLKGGLARLERALGQFMLDVHTNEHGYTEVNPPLLVRDDAMFGTAQLPKFEDDQFFAIAGDLLTKADSEKDLNASEEGPSFLQVLRFSRLGLIPTAEVPLTNLVRESIVEEDALPMRLTALTPCFRAEAGAAGKDTRGMIRQHQFTKVELVSIATPEQSKDEHERMLSCAEEVLRRLDLHYRVVTLCTGDMGFAAQKTYDIEVWLPGQNMYREISSCSNCGAFQARRMGARFRPSVKRVPFVGNARDVPLDHVHTLNGSGVAVGRALIAVMETYQQQDGSIAVPDVLAPYMGGRKTIEHAK
jgi:seryl-tRNA synthetase